MASNLQYFSNVAERTVDELTARSGNWISFLETAARMYKYPFSDQLMIFAQRPDAVSCASIEVWNNDKNTKMDYDGKPWYRRVQRGAKGIALIDDTGSYPRLKYVFDIADTHTVQRGNYRPYIWEMRQEYKEPVMDALAAVYDDVDGTLAESFRNIARELAKEYYNDNARDIRFRAEDSILEAGPVYDFAGTIIEDADDGTLGAAFVDALTKSIAYTLMTRCGLDTSEYFDSEDFQVVLDFNTPDMVYALGTATGELSKQVLRDIESVIKKYELVQAAERSEKENEQSIDVHAARGLSDSRSQAVRTPVRDDGAARQVRTDAESVPEGTQDGQLQPPAADREAVPAPTGSGAGGDSEARKGDESLDGAERLTGQGDRPDGLGGGDERAEGAGGGNGAPRTDLQLEQEKETGADEEAAPVSFAEPAVTVPDAEPPPAEDAPLAGDAPPTFSELGKSALERILSTSSIKLDEVDAILRDGGNFDTSRLNQFPNDLRSTLRIAAYFAKNLDDNADFLKREYLMGRYHHRQTETGKGYVFGSKKVAAWFADEGIMLAAGNGVSGARNSVLVTWEQAAARVKELFDAGQFVSRDVLDEALYNESRERADDVVEVYKNISRGLSDIQDELRNAMNAEQKEATENDWRDHRYIIRGLAELDSRADELLNGESEAAPDEVMQLYNETISLSEELPQEWLFHKRHPDVDERVTELLHDKGAIGETEISQGKGFSELSEYALILNRLGEDVAALADEPDAPIYFYRNPRRALHDLERAGLPAHGFPVAEIPPVSFTRFITEDEIDASLIQSGSYSEGKFRFLSHFLNEHTPEERISFAKDEYGHGGGTYCEINGWRNTTPGKGFALTRGAIGNTEAEVNLNWNTVVKRIDSLVKEGRYMTQAALDRIPEYERIMLARAINSFYYDLPDEYERPFAKGLDFHYPRENEWEAIDSFMGDAERIDATLEQMRHIYANTPEEDRHYPRRKEGLEALTSFRDGTYTLFPGLDRLPAPCAFIARRFSQPVINDSERDSESDFGELPQASEQMSLFAFVEPLLSVEEQDWNLAHALQGESVDPDAQFLNISDTAKTLIAEQFTNSPRSREAVSLVREIYGDSLDMPLPQAIKRITELVDEGRFATALAQEERPTAITEPAEEESKLATMPPKGKSWLENILIDGVKLFTHKERIYQYFTDGVPDITEAAAFLQNTYGKTYVIGTGLGTLDIPSWESDSDGIKVSGALHADWLEVARHVRCLVDAGVYQLSLDEFQEWKRANAVQTVSEFVAEERLETGSEPYSLFEQVREELSERGFEVSEELIENGISGYGADGSGGDVQGAADYIVNEYLTEEPEQETAHETPQTEAVKPDPIQECERIKSENGGAIVMWQVGDFFEMYNEDAKTAAAALNIAMTQRLWSGEPQAGLLTGIPRHSLSNSLRTLNEAGYSVAVASIGAGETRNVTLYEAKPQIAQVEYNIGDSFFYNGKPHEIEQITDFVKVKTIVGLTDYPILDYVSFRKYDFELMLSDGAITIDPPPAEPLDSDSRVHETTDELETPNFELEFPFSTSESELREIISGIVYEGNEREYVDLIAGGISDTALTNYISEQFITGNMEMELDDGRIVKIRIRDDEVIISLDGRMKEAYGWDVLAHFVRGLAEQDSTQTWKYDLISDKEIYLEDGTAGFPRYSYLGGLQIGVVIADEQGREHEREYSRKLLDSVLEKDTRNDYLLITPRQTISDSYTHAEEPPAPPDFDGLKQTVYDRVMADDSFSYHLRFSDSRGALRSTLNTALDKVVGELRADVPEGYFSDDITDELFDFVYRESWANRLLPEKQAAEQPEEADTLGDAPTALEAGDDEPPYKLGDTFYMDDGEPYTVKWIGLHEISYYSPDTPYISKLMEKADFEALLRDNPLNSHLTSQDNGFTEITDPAVLAEVEAVFGGDKPQEILEPPTPTMPPAQNFRITDDNIGEGGAKAKYLNNIIAIKTLKSIENENRAATPQNQEYLSRYVGWGGIPQAFDSKNRQWEREYQELKELLAPEEWQSAFDSTLNAHYTSPIVIKAMYETVERMGFKTGNIVDPGCGIGHFFGLLPDSMKNSRLYGVELDSLTARIAGQLYPHAAIEHRGYERTEFSDAFFDVAVGNVPFGSYSVADRRYKQGFHIHDYFFQKTLDQVRPGGIIAFVTSTWTLDKQNPEVRKYIAQRAEFLGAVRLPNNAFLKNAGAEVATDIIFLQRRERPLDIEPDWVHLGLTEDGLPLNRYYLDNPEMVLGTVALDKRMNDKYGRDDCVTCYPIEGADLAKQLKSALSLIHGRFTIEELDDIDGVDNQAIPADAGVKNFSYALVTPATGPDDPKIALYADSIGEGRVYFRENSLMYPVELPAATLERIKGMIGLRDCVHKLIALQLDEHEDAEIKAQQEKLNALYDKFSAEFGLVNSTANNRAFCADSSYYLLCSLEVLNEDGNLQRKADMFSKRTIKQKTVITRVDTASEALAVSVGEKARVDLAYMSELTGMDEDKLKEDLRGVIFMNVGSADSQEKAYITADEYLSGNIRKKLELAEAAAVAVPSLSVNVDALRAVMPKDLDASEIDARLGATWIDPAYVQQFMYELLDTSPRNQEKYKIIYHPHTDVWQVLGKGMGIFSDINATVTYGTGRANAYEIIDDTLNLRDVRVYDYHKDADGKTIRTLNKKETTLAQQKQELIKQKFRDWVWKDPVRRQTLMAFYNERFNSNRPREYDGSHIQFAGANPEIMFQPHQINAVARQMYGGNTLLAHVVGAGKTFEMVAAAMEGKRLGLCQKSLFSVPNHLTEQWASEFLRLYPNANILVARKKDFEMRNRKKFCAKIATGDYDAVIIGHTQLEKIPMSKERQERLINEQLWEIEEGIRELEESEGDRYAIKQLARMRKSLEARLLKLVESKKRDDVVTFEQLGVDRLFVDEAHNFKDLQCKGYFK